MFFNLYSHFILALFNGAYASSPPTVTADPSLGLTGVLGGNGILNLGTGQVDAIIKHIIFFAFSIAGLVALVVLIYAGFVYATSGGDSNKLEKARATIIKAVIGIAIIVFSYFIANFLMLIFTGQGIPSFSSFFSV